MQNLSSTCLESSVLFLRQVVFKASLMRIRGSRFAAAGVYCSLNQEHLLIGRSI